MAADIPTLIDADEAGRLFPGGRKAPAMRRMAREGRVGGVVYVGERLYFDPEQLREWVRAGGCRRVAEGERDAGR